jgi:adenosylcobinamide-GDP ribazoletransferase
MTPFWIALQFLTTFPVRLSAMPTPQQNAQASRRNQLKSYSTG